MVAIRCVCVLALENWLPFVFSQFVHNSMRMPISIYKSRQFQLNYLLKKFTMASDLSISAVGTSVKFEKQKHLLVGRALRTSMYRCLWRRCFVIDNWYHRNHIEQNWKIVEQQTIFNQIQRFFFTSLLFISFSMYCLVLCTIVYECVRCVWHDWS